MNAHISSSKEMNHFSLNLLRFSSHRHTVIHTGLVSFKQRVAFGFLALILTPQSGRILFGNFCLCRAVQDCFLFRADGPRRGKDSRSILSKYHMQKHPLVWKYGYLNSICNLHMTDFTRRKYATFSAKRRCDQAYI